jgi:hypothetical protein
LDERTVLLTLGFVTAMGSVVEDFCGGATVTRVWSEEQQPMFCDLNSNLDVLVLSAASFFFTDLNFV